MSRWTTYLWRALSADGTRRARQFEVDLSDDASVRAAFRSIVEREWGAAGFRDDTPPRQGWHPGINGSMGQPLPFQFWPWFFPW
jgi:hypothetical protein